MLRLFKNISVYSLGNILNTGVSFFLLPLYTRVLHPADYGKLELIYILGTVLVILYGFNIESGYNRIFFIDKKIIFQKILFGTGQLFNLLCSISFTVIIIINSEWIAKILFEYKEGVIFLKIICLISVFEVLTRIPLNNLRVRQQPKLYVSINLLQLFITMSLTVFLLVVVNLGVLGILYARLIGLCFTLIFLYYVTRGQYIMVFSLYELKLMLGFSIFLIPANLSAIILNMSNRYFIQEYQNLRDVGMFALGAKIAGVIPLLFTEPVKKAFSPYLFEKVDNQEECKKLFADFTKIFLIGLVIVALTISLFSREFVTIMADKAYSGSESIVFVLCMSYVFLGLSSIFVLGIHIARKTWIVTVIFILSALINVLLNIWLIPTNGRMGAAIATLISIIFINVTYLYSLNKVYPIKFEYKTMAKTILLAIMFNIIGSFFVFNIILNIFLKILLMLTFLFILFSINVISKKEFIKLRDRFTEKLSSSIQ
jgi:O-antigen/teichoic acid export membrane protein